MPGRDTGPGGVRRFQRFCLSAAGTSLLCTVALAHHSFAPHFDASRQVSITGVVVEFEQRNPHAYLHLRVEAEGARDMIYRCESHGVTQLARNGISREALAVGTILTVHGVAHRRDPNMCFFREVEFADGRVLSVDAQRTRPRNRVAQRNSIYGTWLLSPSGWRSSQPPNSRLQLTPAAIEAVLAYDPFTEDPTYRCEPVAIRRVWFAPGTPMSISRDQNTITLRYEWMDVVRTVRLDMTEHPSDVQPSILGHSIGWFEDDTLVIETANFTPGVLRQYVEQTDGSHRGLLHSPALTVTERIWFNRRTNAIRVIIDQEDPVYFEGPFNPSSGEFAATDLEIQPFGCIPEVLK